MTAPITFYKPNTLQNLICLKDFGKYLWQKEQRRSQHLLLQSDCISIKLCRMKNSPATFQCLVNSLIINLIGCKAYIYDAIIFSEEWEWHLQTIWNFIDRLSEAKLTVNLTKSEFWHAKLAFLGHMAGQGRQKTTYALSRYGWILQEIL